MSLRQITVLVDQGAASGLRARAAADLAKRHGPTGGIQGKESLIGSLA